MPWWISVAFADEPVPIPPVDPVPSALDEDPDAPGAIEGMVRSRPFLRPQVGVATHEGLVAVRLGGAAGLTVWTLGNRPIRWGGEGVLRATAPIGSASGYRVDLGIHGGPWLGPVGLSIGPLGRVDREDWGADRLPTRFLAGGSADLTLDLGPVGLSGGVQPLWDVASDGRETDWRVGIRGSVGPLDLQAEGVDRLTAVGPVQEVSVGVRVRLR